MVIVIAFLSALAASATPPNVTVGAPYPSTVLEGSQRSITFSAEGISGPQYPDFLWYCSYTLVHHDGIHGYTSPYTPNFTLPAYAEPGYYKVLVNVCGQGGSYNFYSADSVFRIIPNDFNGCSVSLSPLEFPANSPMEITATISGENGPPASFDPLFSGTDRASYVSEVVLLKDGAIAMEDRSFRCNGNQLKANFNFTEVDTGLYVMRIKRDYSCGDYTYIYNQKPIHVTKSTIAPFMTSFSPNASRTGDITDFSASFKYLQVGSGTSETPNKRIRRVYLAKPESDTIDVITYTYSHNQVWGYLCIPHTADTGVYSLFVEAATDDGIVLLTNNSYKFQIYQYSNFTTLLSVEPNEITGGDSVTLTIKCSDKYYRESGFNCYISNTLRDEQYPTTDYVFVSDSVFTCKAFVPETLPTQYGNIMVTSDWLNFYGVAAVKINRRQYELSISPDTVTAGESVFFDVKISNLSNRMRFANSTPQEVRANLSGRTFIPDSVEFIGDSTLRCRFAFPFVAEMEPISISLKYPFGTFGVVAEQSFTVNPAMKIAGVSIDTVIGSSKCSIVITTTDDNFETSDIKSVNFISDEIQIKKVIGKGTYRKEFIAYKFEKVGPKQLQAWFNSNYEDSSRVYYLSIMKTDSTEWLPTEGQRIVVINAMLGAEDENCDELIRVEPNPANSNSELVFAPGMEGEVEVSIVGMDGSETKTKLMLSAKDSETRMPLNDFISSSGVYFIRINSGRSSHTVKCVYVE